MVQPCRQHEKEVQETHGDTGPATEPAQKVVMLSNCLYFHLHLGAVL